MLSELDNFYTKQEEPNKSCLLALREIVLSADNDVTVSWKYGMPFFCYKGKMFCYLWVHKKHNQPYIGFVEGQRLEDNDLILEKRSRMKIILFDPMKDLPIKKIKTLLKQALDVYRNGIIKIKD